ncbi:NTP transferase domain-containing protein [Blastomonas sp. AAP53]|uniref:molybdenum cofactor guanylyltransferase n=1 Tax=Blastomonas sp. AAP53 TaxID=1248760 RepID=UPI000315A67F|nr:NTP transferase domain-containing protein [Blastomonas sp. AAP53]
MSLIPPPLPLVVLLAGGQSRRMAGQDKALADIGGERMIDRVLERLHPQAGAVMLSAPHDYATGLVAIADGPLGPQGPVGAIRAIAAQLATTIPAGGDDRFVTCPVDAPFVPLDLVARLTASPVSAMAEAGGALQPVFALWRAHAVLAALPADRCGERWSLQRLGEAVGVVRIAFDDPDALMNVNTPNDLAEAQRRAAGQK